MFLGYKNNRIIVVANTATELEKMNKYCQFDKIEETDKTYFEYKGEYVCEVSLDELKQAKRDEINKARDEAEQGGFEYLSKVFDSDPVSCQRISCASQTFAMADDTATITWTCQDNTTIELNKPQVMGLVVALTMWANTCHQKASKLKELVNAATSAEEIDAISWDMEIPVEEPEEVVEEPTIEEGSEDLVELYSMEI